MCDVLDRVEKRGISQGIMKGADKQAKKTAVNLFNMGLKPADIAKAVDRSLSLVQKWLGAEMA